MSENNGMFIRVDIEKSINQDSELCKLLVESCPVDIFALGEDDQLTTVAENLDECTLCDICTDAAPDQVRIIKLYRE